MKKAFILFLIGTAIFAALFRFTDIGFILSSLAGIGGMMLIGSILRLVKKAGQNREAARRTPEKDAETTISEGMEKLRRISNTARMIRSNEVAAKIRGICKVGVEIFDGIRKNPAKINKVRQFTAYYLDATGTIVEQYAELSARADKTPEVEAAVRSVEETLDLVKQTFDRQLDYLLEDKLLDINTELTVLKKTMKLEG